MSKLLYASDAARTPELYYLAAKWWREALAEVLPEPARATSAEQAGRMILRENALAVYGAHESRAGSPIVLSMKPVYANAAEGTSCTWCRSTRRTKPATRRSRPTREESGS